MASLLLLQMSDSGSDWEPPPIATRADDGRPPRSLDFDTEKHAVFEGSEDEHLSDEASGNQSAAMELTRDGRGRYDRSSSGKREAWKPHVQRHIEAVRSGNLSSFFGTQCAPGCPQGGKCVEKLGTVQALKQCAAESFGVEALLGDWDNITQNHTACRQWFQRAYAGRIIDGTGAVQSVTYKVGGQLVCAPAWAAMRGIRASTGAAIDRAVRSGQHEWRDGTKQTFDAARRQQHSNFTTAAMVWWTTCAAHAFAAPLAVSFFCVRIRLDPARLPCCFRRLGYYETITKNSTILYPRSVLWKSVYADEFVPEMRGLGLPWKKPKHGVGADGEEDGSGQDGEDGMGGSMATWYDGRQAALMSLAQQRMGLGSKPFTFKSRAKHSAYKECDTCQKGRLGIAEAIRLNLGPDEIRRRKDKLASHLQWMYRQRAELERITQMGDHERCLVENSDKCGDHCLYIPSSARAASANVSKYRYRLSLQANVYAGKLFNLMFLLPNLKTGADFGISSFLAGLCRMFELGEVTSRTRRLFRGMDGGSENVNFAGLGMNNLLVKELHEGSITEVQQHRLPPDHSHTFLTDGTFSVIEGFLTHDGFPGCATVWDMIAYLRRKFAGAEKYLDKRVEITCLLVTFAFTKLFDGHIHADKIRGIGTPSVPRRYASAPHASPPDAAPHTWSPPLLRRFSTCMATQVGSRAQGGGGSLQNVTYGHSDL